MCFLYAHAKGYARRYGCELQTGDWIGRKILQNANEPISTHILPQTELDSNTKKPLDRYFGMVDIDLRLYAQNQMSCDFFTRKDLREWFTLKPQYEALAPKVKPMSVAHLRRGDFCDNQSFSKYYCSVSDRSYDDAIEQFNIPKPVTKVFEGWRETPTGVPKEIEWLPDFLYMRDAKYLLRANSTFSMFASWLGNGITYSPLVEDKVGWQDAPFVLGNHACTAGKFHNQSSIYLKEE